MELLKRITFDFYSHVTFSEIAHQHTIQKLAMVEQLSIQVG